MLSALSEERGGDAEAAKLRSRTAQTLADLYLKFTTSASSARNEVSGTTAEEALAASYQKDIDNLRPQIDNIIPGCGY